MKRTKIIGHVTPVGGNVFRDLGFPPHKARMMLAASNREIDKRRQAQALQGDQPTTLETDPRRHPSLRKVPTRRQRA